MYASFCEYIHLYVIVYWETGGIAWAVSLGFDSERVKDIFSFQVSPRATCSPRAAASADMLHKINKQQKRQYTYNVALLLSIKCVFWFSVRFLFETFLILKRIQWDAVMNVKSFHVKYLLFLSDLIKLEFSGQIFEKKKLKRQNPYSGSRVIACGRIERHDEAFRYNHSLIFIYIYLFVCKD
jgi:hypothetical protein